MSGYLTGILAILSINVVLAYGVFLPVATGQINLGGAAFQAIGAYTAAYLATQNFPPLVAIPAGAVLGGVVGFLISFPVLRMRGVYLVLATFAFAELTGGVIINIDMLGGAMGMTVPDNLPLLPIGLVTIGTVLFVFYLMSTRFGLAMRAVHDDETVSDLMGVGVRRTQVAAFTMGSMLAAIAGGLYAYYFSFVEIQTFNAEVSTFMLLYVLLGGTQTAWGPLVGAVFFTLLPEFTRSFLPQITGALSSIFGSTGGTTAHVDESWRFIILGLITVIMMIFRPEGIVTRSMVDRLKPGRRRGLAVAAEAA